MRAPRAAGRVAICSVRTRSAPFVRPAVPAFRCGSHSQVSSPLESKARTGWPVGNGPGCTAVFAASSGRTQTRPALMPKKDPALLQPARRYGRLP